MINSKIELKRYIIADRIMNGKPMKRSFKEILMAHNNMIIRYLHAMRKYAYYLNINRRRFSITYIMRFYWGRVFSKLGLKLGFSIGPNSLGYGVVIPHYGTIVVNGETRIGNFAVLHTCTCISGKNLIGDYFYLSAGSQITGSVTIGDGVSVAAHSLVNHPVGSNLLLVGSPAEVKRTNYPFWFERDGSIFVSRVQKVTDILSNKI